MHRNLLLPLGVKLEPDYKSDDGILDEDSDDDSVELIDSKNQSYKGNSSKKELQFEVRKEEPESKKERHIKFESQPDIFQTYALSLIQLLHLIQSWKNQK